MTDLRRSAAALLAAAFAALSALGAEPAESPLPAPPEQARAETERLEVAWVALAAGRSMAAYRHFSRATTLDPSCGRSRIGYALTVSALGDLSRGAKSMRYALQVDPDALRELDLTPNQRRLAERVADSCLLRLAENDRDRDVSLYLASLCYLLRDEEALRYAIKIARVNDGRATGTINLERLVEELLLPPEPQPEFQPQPGPRPAPVPTPKPEPEPDSAPEPIQPPAEPAAPIEPVDYEKLRSDMQSVAEMLDHFQRRLVARIEESKKAFTPPSSATPPPAR